MARIFSAFPNLGRHYRAAIDEIRAEIPKIHGAEARIGPIRRYEDVWNAIAEQTQAWRHAHLRGFDPFEPGSAT